MSLEKLVQLGWYKAEPSSSKEIADLFSIVDRSQADMKVEGISDDLRFQAAYNGLLTLANIALRASGFRVSLGQGHHQGVIESIEHTPVQSQWRRSTPETQNAKIRQRQCESGNKSLHSNRVEAPGDEPELVKSIEAVRELLDEGVSSRERL